MAWHTRTCHWFVFNRSYPQCTLWNPTKIWRGWASIIVLALQGSLYAIVHVYISKDSIARRHASPSGSMPQCQCNSGHSNTTTWLALRGSLAAQEKIRTLTYAAGLIIGHHAFYILVVWLWTWTSKSTKFIQGLFASNMDHYKLRSESQLWISCTTVVTARRALVLELWVKRYLTLKWKQIFATFYLFELVKCSKYIESQHIQFSSLIILESP